MRALDNSPLRSAATEFQSEQPGPKRARAGTGRRAAAGAFKVRLCRYNICLNMRALLLALLCVAPVLGGPITDPPTPSPVQAPGCKSCKNNPDCDEGEICEITTGRRKLRFGNVPDGCCRIAD